MYANFNYIKRIVPETSTEFQQPPPVLFPLSGASVDLWFSNNLYYDSGIVSDPTGVLSISRASIGYAQTAAGLLTQFGNNTLRITNLGLLIESEKTNDALWSRDLTNGVWTATNITPVKDQTGPDGVANSASSIVATAGNGTILQSITLASAARSQSAWVKRITGTGTINMTMDNGSTWTAISVTSSWQQLSIPAQTLANPTVGFQIVTSGDKIAVDFVQNEAGSFITSPIPTTTTSATRASDLITLIGNAATLVVGTTCTVVSDLILNVSVNGRMALSDSDADPIFMQFATPTALQANIGGNTLGKTVPSVLSGGKYGLAWNASGRSLTGGGLAPATDAFSMAGATSPDLGSDAGFDSLLGYCRRLTLWNSRLSDTTLQSLTTS